MKRFLTLNIFQYISILLFSLSNKYSRCRKLNFIYILEIVNERCKNVDNFYSRKNSIGEWRQEIED